MSLNIKYIPLYTKDINREVEFFIQYFKLIYAGKIQLGEDLEGVLLKLDVNKDLYLLFIPSESDYTAPKDMPDYKIIINTNDCLKQYLSMKNEGVEFEERPQHLPVGLAARFKLSDGGQYMLLEERDYSESFT